VRLLRQLARGEIEGVIDAEVLQEILHRYRSIRRWKEGREVYLFVRRILTIVAPITTDVTDLAWTLLDSNPRVMARDALHAAVCRSQGIRVVCSYDKDFENFTELERVEPDALI
jgi:predicted nucleic acid-binding protein